MERESADLLDVPRKEVGEHRVHSRNRRGSAPERFLEKALDARQIFAMLLGENQPAQLAIPVHTPRPRAFRHLFAIGDEAFQVARCVVIEDAILDRFEPDPHLGPRPLRKRGRDGNFHFRSSAARGTAGPCVAPPLWGARSRESRKASPVPRSPRSCSTKPDLRPPKKAAPSRRS